MLKKFKSVLKLLGKNKFSHPNIPYQYWKPDFISHQRSGTKINQVVLQLHKLYIPTLLPHHIKEKNQCE